MMVAIANLQQRASGILLHPTSLPGPHGCGDLGLEAHRFADQLVDAEQSFWQMLPVGPVGYGNSPYSAQSAFAGSPLLIALAPLVAAGYLPASELTEAAPLPTERVDYAATERFRTHCLRRASELAQRDPDFERYRRAEREWLDDYALFRALKTRHGEVEWTRWPAELRDRDPRALARAREELASEVAFRACEQWLFDRQWRELRAHCHARGVALIGDLPIFLAHDSADVWQHRELFQLHPDGTPRLVSGVPPDYFSKTGQRWGNPLYDWARLRESGYAWWVARMRSMLSRFDIVRLDHFIGFERYWEVPAEEETAEKGRWVKGPSDDLFRALESALGEPLPLIAEDLGEVTPEVLALRDRFGLPGIRILQFAFGADPMAHSFLPHNHEPRAVVFTGTHDNDTCVGWFNEQGGEGSTRSPEQCELERRNVLAYLGGHDVREVHWDMIRMCMLSVARTAIFPLQDVLGLGSEARMNRPGVAAGNWDWRFGENALRPELLARLAGLTRLYDRQLSAAAGERKGAAT
jgi:4-alpha-glucanotransferase